MEIGVESNTINITRYGKGRKGKGVARHKEITCKRYSHAKTKNDEQVPRYKGGVATISINESWALPCRALCIILRRSKMGYHSAFWAGIDMTMR